MPKGSLPPFLSRSKSVAAVDLLADHHSQHDAPARPSTSSVFPSLRRLDTSGPPAASVRSAARMSAAGAGLGSTRSSSKPTPLLSLKLTGPSFLDVVIRDRANKEPVYICETVRDSTSIYRLNAETEEATKVATVHWPSTITRSKSKSGRTVQMANDRWRDAEEFLKLGPLGSMGTRKFNIPHYPHSFKWKLIPGGHFYCTTPGANGPFAILDSSVLNAPARLSIFHNCLEEGETRKQECYSGIPVLLLDYLITTSLLLVTEVQEWMDREQTPTGTVRIPGSSIPAVKKWLAIIHNDPLPASAATSPADTMASSAPWGSEDNRRISGSSSPPGSGSGTSIPTPSTPATSTLSTSFQSPFAPSMTEDAPPVPPLPPLPSTSHRPMSAQGMPVSNERPMSTQGMPPQSEPSYGHITPYPHSFHSSSTPQLPMPHMSVSPPAQPAVRPPRRLPKPPILPLNHAGDRQPWQATDGQRSTDYVSPPSDAQLPQRSPSPSVVSSSSGSGTSSHNRNRGSRSSMGRLMPPPPVPPPASSLPLPPKLAYEMGSTSPPSHLRTSQTFAASPLGQSSSSHSQLQTMNPDPLDPQDEARMRELTSQMLSLHTSPRQPIVPSTSTAPDPYSGMHLDAGAVRMRDAAQRNSYAETVYDMPPPAYDAIDFSLPRVQFMQHQSPGQGHP
ncbi:hypothetical protein K474DRAFT_1708768 [Panus rudis PR-1116 ss-1]|nr:hypothetical protein K474DRAFT_1708768 [Panus rudis PR-1116 ss-1]